MITPDLVIVYESVHNEMKGSFYVEQTKKKKKLKILFFIKNCLYKVVLAAP